MTAGRSCWWAAGGWAPACGCKGSRGPGARMSLAASSAECGRVGWEAARHPSWSFPGESGSSDNRWSGAAWQLFLAVPCGVAAVRGEERSLCHTRRSLLRRPGNKGERAYVVRSLHPDPSATQFLPLEVNHCFLDISSDIYLHIKAFNMVYPF